MRGWSGTGDWCLVGRLVGRLVGWLAGWLVDWLVKAMDEKVATWLQGGWEMLGAGAAAGAFPGIPAALFQGAARHSEARSHQECSDGHQVAANQSSPARRAPESEQFCGPFWGT
eukprot:Skav228708  [mRNA]  locus=scaffold3960:114378:114873:- [translate_table: standard]